MLKIVADDKIPFLKGVLEPFAEVIYLPGKQITRKTISGADALLIRTRTKCTGELLEKSQVKFIGTATIGFDHIDTQYCNRNEIMWTNAPGCNSASVKQYITAALLKTSREFRFNLKDKTIGIVGAGNVGSKVESVASELGMRVLINDPPRARAEGDKGFHELDDILKEADIITFHVPLTFVGEERTYHLVNDRLIKKMKKGVWLINSSRGEVCDTGSLKKGLDSGRLAGAIIDVWEHEPDIDLALMQKAFIATPHIAGYSTDGKANGTSMVVNELAKFFELPVSQWYPADVPAPLNGEINIDGKKKTAEEVLREAVEHTYSISEDDLKLRFSPSDFEKLRGDYPLRREFPAYTVKTENCTRQAVKLLMNVGFRCLDDK